MMEWGTLFPPDLSAVNNKVEEINEQNLAVYEVRIELDNGAWRVDIFWQNEDLDAFGNSYYMDVHGGMNTNGHKIKGVLA